MNEFNIDKVFRRRNLEDANKAYDEVIRYKGIRYSSLVGSVAINGEGEDIDILVFGRKTFLKELINNGYKETFDYEADGKFLSYRKGHVNIIYTNKGSYYDKWISANELCIFIAHKLGVKLDKELRVIIHEMVKSNLNYFDALDFAWKYRNHA